MHFGFLGVGEGDVDQADGLVFGAAGGAGDAGDAQAEGCAGAQADAVGEGFGDFGGDGAVLRRSARRDAGEGGLECVGVDDGAAEERARAAGDAGDALRRSCRRCSFRPRPGWTGAGRGSRERSAPAIRPSEE